MGISSDAIAGFAGVVTGSVITGGLQYVLIARTERHDRRAAKRLVQAELLAMRISIDHGIAEDNWDTVLEVLKDRSRWELHHERLARDLDQESWAKVERAYRAQYAVVRIAELPSGHAEKDEGVYKVALTAMEEAIERLK